MILYPQPTVDKPVTAGHDIRVLGFIHPSRSFFASVMRGINPRHAKAESGA
jgi:hypothetical protein